MSLVNSSHDHDLASSISPSITKLHSSRGVWGVGPAERTGKPSTRYWPGGMRSSPSARLRRPRKPREMNPLPMPIPPTVVLRPDFIHSGTPPKAGSNMMLWRARFYGLSLGSELLLYAASQLVPHPPEDCEALLLRT